jgi:hypothetical protein
MDENKFQYNGGYVMGDFAKLNDISSWPTTFRTTFNSDAFRESAKEFKLAMVKAKEKIYESALKTTVVLLTPKKVIYNRKERTTVVIWEDSSKTISRAGETEDWSEEMGYAVCLLKKLYGSRSGYRKMLEKVSYRELSKEEKKERVLERKEKSLENIKKNAIQVIVTRSKYDSTWYADCVGEMFNVVGYDEENWMVTDLIDVEYDDFKDQGYVIRRSDCKKVK